MWATMQKLRMWSSFKGVSRSEGTNCAGEI
jgi:hypothetical protein